MPAQEDTAAGEGECAKPDLAAPTPPVMPEDAEAGDAAPSTMEVAPSALPLPETSAEPTLPHPDPMVPGHGVGDSLAVSIVGRGPQSTVVAPPTDEPNTGIVSGVP